MTRPGIPPTARRQPSGLPERLFTRPLAKALVEQRRRLILDPDAHGEVEQLLAALLVYLVGLIDNSGTHIAIASVASRLRASAGQDDIDEAIRMLWQIAVGIEDGTAANAKAELEALRKELERALAEGAPPERIAELMAEAARRPGRAISMNEVVT